MFVSKSGSMLPISRNGSEDGEESFKSFESRFGKRRCFVMSGLRLGPD